MYLMCKIDQQILMQEYTSFISIVLDSTLQLIIKNYYLSIFMWYLKRIYKRVLKYFISQLHNVWGQMIWYISKQQKKAADMKVSWHLLSQIVEIWKNEKCHISQKLLLRWQVIAFIIVSNGINKYLTFFSVSFHILIW